MRLIEQVKILNLFQSDMYGCFCEKTLIEMKSADHKEF